jgi:hypothetical protein
MGLSRWFLMALSGEFGRDFTLLVPEGEDIMRAAICDASAIIDRHGLVRKQTKVEVVPAAELINSEPIQTFRGQNSMTAKLRRYIAAAAEVSVAGLDYVSVSEFDVREHPEQGVVHLFLFWSRKIYVPKHKISDPLVLDVIPSASEILETMIEKVSSDAVWKADLKKALPHGWRMQLIRWLHRDPGIFRPGIHWNIPGAGASLRADGVATIFRFFRTDNVREAVIGNSWLLVSPGQAALVVRSSTRLDDAVAGMRSREVSGNIWRNTCIPDDPDLSLLNQEFREAKGRMA